MIRSVCNHGKKELTCSGTGTTSSTIRFEILNNTSTIRSTRLEMKKNYLYSTIVHAYNKHLVTVVTLMRSSRVHILLTIFFVNLKNVTKFANFNKF